MSSIKIQRLESLIFDLLSNAIVKKIYDPLIKQVNIQYVKLSNDKSVAKIYISCYDKKLIDPVLKKINQTVGFFRNVLAQNLTIRKAPHLIFLKDETFDRVNLIESVLEKIKKDDEKK